jgi:4-hydroxy-tetrahydrodipicolinate synthase
MFKGSIPALVTPFKGGAVDETAYQSLIEWQIEEGTDGIVTCGTTGESATLHPEEQFRVTQLCVESVAGRIPVMAGGGSNSTEKTIELTKGAKKAGADAALVVTPYYNKPSQEGVYQHFKAVNDAVDIPIIVYNIPSRSVVDITVETMTRLASLPNVVGVKDSTNDLTRPLRERQVIDKEFCWLSGDDPTGIAYLASGGVGCISVTAIVAPRLSADMYRAWREGDVKKAMALQDRLMPLHTDLFCDANPGPVKYALSLLGKCEPGLRLPMTELSDVDKETVRRAMETVGLLVDKAA